MVREVTMRVEGLRHRFGQRVALDDISFEVAKGEIVGLVGRNGAGKTTTMRSIMGIVQPMAGTTFWHDHPVGPTDRRQFGYMPEERGLYPQMRLLEQLRYFGELYGSDHQTATDQAH